MTFHFSKKPPRLVAPGGPVSPAIRAMRTNVLLPDFIGGNFSAAGTSEEHALIHALRDAIQDRIEADIALLDALGGDPDLEDGGDREIDAGDEPEGVFYGAHDATEEDEHDEAERGIADRDGLWEQTGRLVLAGGSPAIAARFGA